MKTKRACDAGTNAALFGDLSSFSSPHRLTRDRLSLPDPLRCEVESLRSSRVLRGSDQDTRWTDSTGSASGLAWHQNLRRRRQGWLDVAREQRRVSVGLLGGH